MSWSDFSFSRLPNRLIVRKYCIILSPGIDLLYSKKNPSRRISQCCSTFWNHKCQRDWPFVNPKPLLFSFFSFPSRAFILISFLVTASCGFTLIMIFSIPPNRLPGCAKCNADHAGCSRSRDIICCSSNDTRVAKDAGGRGVYSTLKCDSIFSIRSFRRGDVGSVRIELPIVFSR